MPTLDENASGLRASLNPLQPLLVGLRKYEANFSPEANQYLQVSITSTQQALDLVSTWPTMPSIAGYLSSGARFDALKQSLGALQRALSSMLSGSMPLPRSSKEELVNLSTHLSATKLEVPTEQLQLAVQLKTLYGQATDAKHDVDAIEAQLDELMKQVLQNIFGVMQLPEEELKKELSSLEGAARSAKEANAEGTDAAILGLALNSLQRLHASQIKVEESEEDVEQAEEDEDDPFFMPMMPAAVKLAEAGKFSMLAEPLGPDQPKQFMIAMDTDVGLQAACTTLGTDGLGAAAAAAAADSAAAAAAAEDESPGLTAQDFEPVPIHEQATASNQAAAAAAAAAEHPAAAAAAGAGEMAAPTEEPVATATAAAASSSTPPPAADRASVSAPTPQEAKPLERNSRDTDAVLIPLRTAPPLAPGAPPHEEKLKQFVNFLQGDNPGACMFHAQMRLSLEGCRKLSNFLKGSARVRALSLSHNHLGDDGLKIICEGLSVNKSVTALDLPDNSISDSGCIALAQAIGHNASLTQLQLAYNKISDHGAAALAEVIKSNQSLKKLGLSYNNVGKAGCQALTAAISTNQSLKHLQLLPGNPVEEKDAKALAKALKRNKKFSFKTFLGIE